MIYRISSIFDQSSFQEKQMPIPCSDHQRNPLGASVKTVPPDAGIDTLDQKRRSERHAKQGHAASTFPLDLLHSMYSIALCTHADSKCQSKKICNLMNPILRS